MDKSSINSLNSRRNFKLPPIQGALPATVYGDRSWNTNNNQPSLSTHGTLQPHVRIKRESIPNRDFHCLHRATLQTRTDSFPKKKAFPSSRQQTTVEITNLGHEFPKSYSVLPPISKDKHSIDNANVGLLSATKINPVKREPRATDKKYSTTSELLSERRRERLYEKQKARNGINHKDQSGANSKTEAQETEQKEIEPSKSAKTEETKELVNRKPSATYLSYRKSRRIHRRGGVCPENESSLVNVTEQLKEIFLRRNMEEMYLI